MTFGETLQKLRRQKGMTQRKVADLIEMDYGYFSRLENDKSGHQPSRETIDKIADALECTEAEQGELLAAAGRIDDEMESVARRAHEIPELKQLFRAAAQLSPEKIKEVVELLQSKNKAASKLKRGGK